MLTVSDIASIHQISYQQVQDLIQFGYLAVADIERHKQKGIRYLFAEEEVRQLDVHSHLAEIQELKKKYHHGQGQKSSSFKKIIQTIHRYDNFLESIENYPESELLRICFYLFHLNHYAKTYPERSKELYALKSRVLRKMYSEHPQDLKAVYLQGPDRKKIWLCDDCRDAAQNANMSYVRYIQQEYYCPKCEIQVVDKEYFSLIEFTLTIDAFHFCFHQPRSKVLKWMKDLDRLPHRNRHTGNYTDQMYMYGRSVSRIEEKVFPLKMIEQALNNYVSTKIKEA